MYRLPPKPKTILSYEKVAVTCEKKKLQQLNEILRKRVEPLH